MIKPKSGPIPTASPRADPHWPEGEGLRRALAQGDRALGRIGPILGHLLSTRDQSLFSDELVARIRSMLTHLAWQVLRVQAEATGVKGREEFAAEHGESLSETLFASLPLVAHCHALALEWQLSARMEGEFGLDPVISPLLQSLIGHEDAGIASGAMASLAAQARYAQTQRRMSLPLSELPGDLFHALLLAWRAYNGDDLSDALVRAEGRLRAEYDEAAGRLSLLERVATLVGKDATNALIFDQAGIGLAGKDKQRLAVACGKHGGLVHDPGLAPALDIIGLAEQHAGNGERFGIDRLAEQLGGGGGGCECSDGQPLVACGLSIGGDDGGGLGGPGMALDGSDRCGGKEQAPGRLALAVGPGVTVVGSAHLGGCDGAGGVDAVVQGCELLAALGLDREHAGLGGDGLAGGESCGSARKPGCGAGYEVAGRFGACDGGEDIGMGGTAARADAGIAFELG
jgi:hypothetical protein